MDEKEVFQFPKGLPGFPEEKAFVFLPYQPDSPFAFLQSVITAELTFMLVDPFVFFQGYQVKLRDDDVEDLALSEENPAHVWAIVTVPEKFEKMTANLVAPVVFNVKERKAAQVVLENKEYTTRHAVFPEGIPKQQAKKSEQSTKSCAEAKIAQAGGEG
ncbi:flagellar assembly protein FliW [Heliorestis acidaminivorans]|uniref:flagellar assembly protein FliW n=1 Tax=Heliorestis acidaminivorans TaxID=553427 RepID=UPI001A9BB43B|nr:flagellar assembly protein FliW [Heliorestis acidaminivorans]